MPLITTPPGTSTRDLLDRVLASERVQPVIAVETSQREAIGPLVLEGAGVGFLPTAAAAELEHRGAVLARVTPTLSRVIGLVHRAQPLSPAARAFVELARQSS
jgi:DNA-binding transcriptional LysR family regulator